MSALAVTLTVDELRALIREEVRAASATPSGPSVASTGEVLTRKQAAELLQVNEHYMPKLIRERGLPAHRLGNEWRFQRSELLEWLSKQKGAA